MGGRKRKTTEWFIAKALSIYGDRFDYSKSCYLASSKNIEIICRIHGSFWQRSAEHFLGRGCPMCNTRLTREEFVARSKRAHGEKYDYSKITAPSLHSELAVAIICPHHGEFMQRCSGHMSGKGCIKCGFERTAQSIRRTQEHFLARAVAIHGDLYDYSKTKYEYSSQKVEIICKEHGSFWQTPANHVHKRLRQGCPACAGNIRLTKEQFIKRAVAVHGDRYDYSQVDYVASNKKVKIVCKNHGIFQQSPYDHMSNKRCPKCTYRVSKPEAAWLNSLNIPKEWRMKSLTMACGKRFEVDAYDPVTNTVYEFNGDYWHGNPAKFASDGFNERSKCTFGELYQRTLAKTALLQANGFNVVDMWESDFKKMIHAKSA